MIRSEIVLTNRTIEDGRFNTTSVIRGVGHGCINEETGLIHQISWIVKDLIVDITVSSLFFAISR